MLYLTPWIIKPSPLRHETVAAVGADEQSAAVVQPVEGAADGRHAVEQLEQLSDVVPGQRTREPRVDKEWLGHSSV
jgi:hypothetical protein